jgi:hypothetical protein
MLTALRLYAARRPRGFFLVLIALLGIAGATPFVIHIIRSHDGVHVEVLGGQFTAPPGNGPNTPGDGGAGTSPGGGGAGTGTGTSAGDQLNFTFSAKVTGLKPGSPQILPVVVTNPSTNIGTLTVNTIVVRPGNAVNGTTVTCAGSNLAIGQYDSTAPGATSYVISAGASKTVSLSVLFKDLLDVDQTSCQGKVIPLIIEGTATVTG